MNNEIVTKGLKVSYAVFVRQAWLDASMLDPSALFVCVCLYLSCQ